MSADFEKIAKELMHEGKAAALMANNAAIKSLAESEAAQKLKNSINPESLKSALQTGNTDELEKTIKNVMNTKEGVALARQLSELLK